jgi:hypothetical protein
VNVLDQSTDIEDVSVAAVARHFQQHELCVAACVDCWEVAAALFNCFSFHLATVV